MTLLVHPSFPDPHADAVDTVESVADSVAGRVAGLLEDVTSCDDPARLRNALWVLAGALPDLMATTEPVDAVIATARQALAGTWP